MPIKYCKRKQSANKQTLNLKLVSFEKQDTSLGDFSSAFNMHYNINLEESLSASVAIPNNNVLTASPKTSYSLV